VNRRALVAHFTGGPFVNGGAIALGLAMLGVGYSIGNIAERRQDLTTASESTRGPYWGVRLTLAPEALSALA